MRLMVKVRRFLVPRPLVSLYYFLKYRAVVSLRAEVEFSPLIRLGKGAQIGSFVKIKASEGPIRIGARTDVGVGTNIGGYRDGVEIGDDCLISPRVSIIGNKYRYDRVDQTFREQGKTSEGTLRIGNNVWIGAGAVILDGADIGDGVIIAPLSVVSGKIPENAMVQGNPGKVIFTRR
jgi:acetyltransferase-like isoleucine patch superfamily enzyme